MRQGRVAGEVGKEFSATPGCLRVRIGVIGGTGLYDWGPGESVDVETEFGNVAVTHHRRAQHQVFFVARHGRDHSLPAHRVDARPIIRALQAAHCDYVFAFFNVGALDPSLRAGDWAVLSDLIDLTSGRRRTFHDEEAVHVDLSRPFCPTARKALAESGRPKAAEELVYATTDGPRFETRAEAGMLAHAGAHVVGMTAGPEAALAREAGLCYAGVAFVANGSEAALPSAKDVQRRLARAAPHARAWADRAIGKLPASKRCDCAKAVIEASVARPRGHRR